MDITIPTNWIEIGRRPKQWFGGIIAIRNCVTGRTYFVATRNVGRRARNQIRWLTRDEHKNHELQKDWMEFPGAFHFYLVERVLAPVLLPYKKQWLIDRYAKLNLCYNLKRALPRTVPTKPRPLVERGSELELDEQSSFLHSGGEEGLQAMLDEFSTWTAKPRGVAKMINDTEMTIAWAKKQLGNACSF
jgi:hypothetical protein